MQEALRASLTPLSAMDVDGRLEDHGRLKVALVPIGFVKEQSIKRMQDLLAQFARLPLSALPRTSLSGQPLARPFPAPSHELTSSKPTAFNR